MLSTRDEAYIAMAVNDFQADDLRVDRIAETSTEVVVRTTNPWQHGEPGAWVRAYVWVADNRFGEEAS